MQDTRLVEPHLELIERQAALVLERLRPWLLPERSAALVDFPDHHNVGDSAIWLGELALFRRLTALAPGYVCTIENYAADALAAACPQGPIFIHGGGNFGDIYPKHQQFRLRLMHDFPDRDIVQLPQSISFSSAEAARPTAQAIARHGRFFLMVRDRPSQRFAAEHLGCNAELLPDMAFGMGPLRRPHGESTAVFMLLREDAEKAAYDRTPLLRRPDAVSADWIWEPASFPVLARWRTHFSLLPRRRLKSGQAASQWTALWRAEHYRQLAAGRVRRGLRLLSSGHYVVTDRLHAHILSTMMNIPHVVLDNSYGKIGGYMDSWSGRYEHLRRARSAEECLVHLAQWGLE